MKTPELKIIPDSPIDEKRAKMMEILVNDLYAKNRKFIEAITAARLMIEKKYGIKTDEQPWEMIMSAYAVMLTKGGKE